MKKLQSLLLSALLLGNSIMFSVSLPGLGALEEAGKNLLPIELEKKQAEQLETLKKEKQDLDKEFAEHIKGILNELKVETDAVKASLEQDPDNDFYGKKLSLLNMRQQVLREQEQEHEQLMSTLDQHIKILEDYLRDPQLENYQQKELKIGNRPVYSFADLQMLYEQTVQLKKRLEQLNQKEKNISAQLENRKKGAAATIEEFKKKQDAYEKQKKSETYTGDSLDLSMQQRDELFKLERQLFEDRKELDNIRQRTIEHQMAMIKSQVFIERAQLDIVKELLRRVKPAIRVSESEITQAKDALARRKQQLFKDKEPIRYELEEVSGLLKKLETSLEALSKKNNVLLGPDIDEWNRAPRQTVAAYLALFEVGALDSEVLQVKSTKALHETLLVLEDERFLLDEIKVKIQESFYLLSSKKDLSEDDIKREIKEYDKPRAEVQEKLSLYTELRNGTETQLEVQKRALDNITKLKDRVERSKDALFKNDAEDYVRALDLLAKANESVKQQVEVLGKVRGNYVDILSYLTNIGKHIEFITAELSNVVLWQRPEVAISWSDIQTIYPDIQMFVASLQHYMTRYDIGILVSQTGALFAKPLDVALAMLGLILLLILVWLIRRFAPFFIARLKLMVLDSSGLSLFIAMILEFIVQHFILIAAWCSVCAFLQLHAIHDIYYYVLFYLVSIPYLLYLVSRFIQFFIQFNTEMGYPFVAQDFQKRIELVLSWLLYATIIIFFFREAFILVSSGKSKLPIILLALNVIIFQISLILILSKQHLLSAIPDNTVFWEWVHAYINRYYYVILACAIVLIVMINPYVGFGVLVQHVLYRSIQTGFALLILYHIHLMIKRRISYIFFDAEQDVVRERFPQSKTWYGATVIALFLIFIFMSIVICAHIWGWPEALADIKTWADVQELLKTEIMFQGSASPISVLSIIKILSFFVGGALVSFAMNRFVLGKIFNVMLVDAGVQNAVSSIMRYVILAASIILGFESVGLHKFVEIFLGVLLVSIGWIVKDPMADFIAYFIILVQRPLKVGDYVFIDLEAIGVVRKITARSVVIRRKNSTTVIVPNSKVINQPVVNWNYVRSFIAFDDILLTVAHKEDPARVKELLLKVLDESPYVLKSPRPIVRFEAFNDFGYTFLVRGFLSSNYTLEQFDIASDVRIEIVRTLRAHKIEIAIPARMIYQHDGSQKNHTGIPFDDMI